LEKLDLIRNALRIFIVMTFYDQDESFGVRGVTEKLLSLNVLESLKFFLTFLNPLSNSILIINTIMALGNISSNVGIHILFDDLLLIPIIELFNAPENPAEVRAEASILYLSTISKIKSNSQELKSIRSSYLESDERSENSDVVTIIFQMV
jgi:hypothetical protein